MPDNNKQIIVKKEYFDNIQTAIDSLNSFFSSGFKTKNFPVFDGSFQLDNTIMRILSWFSSVEPSWINDFDKIDSVIDVINEKCEDITGDVFTELTNRNDKATQDHIYAFIGFKMLQFISDHFTEFSTLINSIYSLEIFTKPSKYRNEIDLFTQDIPLDEISYVIRDNHFSVFNIEEYVKGVFDNEQIILPVNMNVGNESKRINSYIDLQNIEIVIDDSVQEAAEVNFFEDTKPKHIKYDESTDTFKVSVQLKNTISKLINDLEKCDSTDDLKAFFSNDKTIKENYPDTFTKAVIPFIIAKVFGNENKYPSDKFDIESLNKYLNSYKSISDKNPGAKRFINYDIFSTFKTDKSGTLKFVEDFLTLNLYNDTAVTISNNTLLTLFNIFDSRIYFDILYNMIPNKVKNNKYPTEDGFVKQIRARINKNSRSANVYQPDNKAAKDNDLPTTEDIKEYTVSALKEFGNMSISDMMYCEQFHSILRDEINCIGDTMYNKGISQIAIDNYIGRSHDVIQETVSKTHTELCQELEDLIGVNLPKDYIDTIPWDKTSVTKFMDKYSNTDVVISGKTVFGIEEILSINQVISYRVSDNYGIDDKSLLIIATDGYGNAIVLDLTDDMYYAWYHDQFDNKGKHKLIKISKYFAPSGGKDNLLDKLVKSKITNESFIQEVNNGEIPDYMKTRIKLSDEMGTTPNVTTTDVQIPPDTPTNPVDDLTGSINTKVDTGGDNIGDMLGAGYNNNPNKKNEGNIVYNITYNYNNSFNKDNHSTNNDLSSGKNMSHNTSVTNNNTNSHNDSSTNKRINNNTSRTSRTTSSRHPDRFDNNRGGNNNNNSIDSVDTKDTRNVKPGDNQEFSTGHTVQEVFTFLESEEPLSNGNRASKPPKRNGDLTTAMMDADRKILSKQQSGKKHVQKAVNTVKAVLKPVTRTKQWLAGIVDSLVKRNEDKVKAEIIENPSYRTALYKAGRLALKLGMTGVAFTISGYLGAAYVVVQGAKIADKQRLKKEVQEEFATEMQILDDKIRLADAENTPESQKAKWQMMRLRSKMQSIVVDTPRSTFKHPRSIS